MNKVLSKIIALAAERHSDQFDKSGKPYILHCLAVMNMIAAENPEDYELMTIAVGHDLIEDTKTTYAELYSIGCSSRIVAGINAMTKRPGETYDEYVDRIMHNDDAKKVKLKDLTHNSDIRRLKGLTQKDLDRLQKYCALYARIKESM